MPYGGRIGSYRYAHWLFTPTPLFFLIAGIGLVLAICAALASSFGFGARERAGQRWLIALWLGYATFIFGIAYNEGSAFPLTQRTIRQSAGPYTYVLQGMSSVNVSGHMFYWLYECDRLELVCMYLTNESLTVFEGSEPQFIVDQDQQSLWVIAEGKTLVGWPMPE